ncbi:hypothetical protein [Ruminococcus sp. Marseille-P6503]|uniref:hypothetical protein n=1 Tax=Ruminococcus sp. Marseille-P6503 TaxID=2364796 RepID=UPI000F538E1B|nr:hypothetical protein [Ruminococcus sp. Marseille-P6503]
MKKLKDYNRPKTVAAVHIAVWAAAAYGIFFFTTEVSRSLIPFILGFLFVYPLGTLYTAFRYTRRYGLKWYFILPAAAIAAVMYFLLGFDMVEPNYLVMTAVAVFFGAGIGRQFYTAAETTAKKLSKAQLSERGYRSILDESQYKKRK